jgi:Ulp1 family protease
VSVTEDQIKKMVGLAGKSKEYVVFMTRLMKEKKAVEKKAVEEETLDGKSEMDHRAPTMLFDLTDEKHREAQSHHTNMHMLSTADHKIKNKREKSSHEWRATVGQFNGEGYELMGEPGWSWKSTKWQGIEHGWITT